MKSQEYNLDVRTIMAEVRTHQINGILSVYESHR